LYFGVGKGGEGGLESGSPATDGGAGYIEIMEYS
jgi:hypothetical protein